MAEKLSMPIPLKDLYHRYQSQFEDFWGRRDNELKFKREFRIFGCPVEILSNHEQVLDSADFSASLYSTAPHQNRQAFRLRFIVRPPTHDPGPPPAHPFDAIQYTGEGDWINIHFGLWGNAFADLRAGLATAVLTPQLAARPDLISRGLLNTLINNYLTRNGFAMLHATGLVRAGRVLLLMAPHNSGKSTTALRLTLSREFQMLSDSQIYVTHTLDGLQLTGFPVGRGKLRRDMLSQFPDLHPLLTPEYVRDETKYVLDLRQRDSNLVYGQAIYPDQIDLCLLKRNDQMQTSIREAALEEVWESIMQNSLHNDYPDIWVENLRLIELLVNRARIFHLDVGTDGDRIVGAILGIGD
jgi:hypothetical protein